MHHPPKPMHNPILQFCELSPEQAAEVLAKTADFGEAIRSLGSSLSDPSSTANPMAWETGRNALIGAGVGGVGGALAAGSGRRGRGALEGGLLGAGLGGGSTMLYRGLQAGNEPTPEAVKAEADTAQQQAGESTSSFKPYDQPGEVHPEVPTASITERVPAAINAAGNHHYGVAAEHLIPDPTGAAVGAVGGVAAGKGIQSLLDRRGAPGRIAGLDAKTLQEAYGDPKAIEAIRAAPAARPLFQRSVFKNPIINPAKTKQLLGRGGLATPGRGRLGGLAAPLMQAIAGGFLGGNRSMFNPVTTPGVSSSSGAGMPNQ